MDELGCNDRSRQSDNSLSICIGRSVRKVPFGFHFSLDPRSNKNELATGIKFFFRYKTFKRWPLSYNIIRVQQDYNTEALEVHYRRTHEYLPKHVDPEKTHLNPEKTHLNQVVYMAPFLEGNPPRKLKEFVERKRSRGHIF